MQPFHSLSAYLVISSLTLIPISSAFVQALAQAECGNEIYVIKESPAKVEPHLVSQNFVLVSKTGTMTEVFVTPPALSFEEQSAYFGNKARFADLLLHLSARNKLGNVQEVILKGKLNSSEIDLLEKCTQLQCLEVDSASGLQLRQFPKLRRLKVHNADSAAVESASKLKSLEEILFRNIKSCDASLVKLSTLPVLRILDLQFVPNSRVSANTIAHFGACKQLTEFNMLGVCVTNEIAHALCKITTLRCLYLDKPEDKRKFNSLCKILRDLPDLCISNYLTAPSEGDVHEKGMKEIDFEEQQNSR